MDKICIIGLWHQGVVGAACLADLGHEVIAADSNEQTVRALQSGRAPLFEPGLDDLLQKALKSGRLTFNSKPAAAVKGCKFALIMFDTPVDENDQSDLSPVFAAAREIAPNLEQNTVILVTAQVPVGTCARLEAEIKQINPALNFAVAYSPENLQLGQAIERFIHPPLRVIGSDSPRALDRLECLLSVISGDWERVSLATAEMVKHALNAYLATTIAFANELGNLCDRVGADGVRLAQILRNDPRIGVKAMLFPGLGFSGGTLARDMQTLINLGRRAGLETHLLDGAWRSNLAQNQTVAMKLRRFFGTLENKKIAVLGLAYKPETSTLRRSLSLDIIAELVREKAVVTAHDPRADRTEIGKRTEFSFKEDVYQAVSGADALLLITGWKEYKNLDYRQVRELMKGKLLMDPNNLLDRTEMEKLGFQYVGIGRGYGEKA